MATLIRKLKLLVSKGNRSRQVLPGSRPEHEIRRELEREMETLRNITFLQESPW